MDLSILGLIGLSPFILVFFYEELDRIFTFDKFSPLMLVAATYLW